MRAAVVNSYTARSPPAAVAAVAAVAAAATAGGYITSG